MHALALTHAPQPATRASSAAPKAGAATIPTESARTSSGVTWPRYPRKLSRMNYWLVKQEPEDYSWDAFARDKRAAWTGVRNFQARNNLRAMKKGDSVFYYHSGEQKQVVGIARVVKEAYPDPTAEDGAWVAVDLAPVKPLEKPVTLQTVKADKLLRDMALAKNSRLSVSPVTGPQADRLLEFAETSF
jgi:predicted RNA-binding protein with PUA-like domain